MIIDSKEIYIRVMHPRSEYEEFEKFMTLNAELIGICQEMRNLIKKFGVFSKVIDGKRIFTDGRDD